jgi:hypothetical protein
MNYLVLTPDGVGSTYLQRALSVYLNSAGLDYWNTHELLNGLRSDGGNLRKKWGAGGSNDYSQSLQEICKLLDSTKNNLVSRVAQYHVRNRLRDDQEDYTQFYKTCNRKFSNILCCKRDPFEYALSWGIREETKALNVYSVTERSNIHGEKKTHTIDLAYFNDKLQEYADYEYWARDNFNITNSVNYDDMHHDADKIMQKLTGLDYCINNTFGVSLQDYSTVRYLTSRYTQTKDRKFLFDPSKAKGSINLHKFILKLVDKHKLVTGIPVKMNTLQDKKKRIKNFDNAVNVYNKWANATNSHRPITEEHLTQQISEENTIYVNK